MLEVALGSMVKVFARSPALKVSVGTSTTLRFSRSLSETVNSCEAVHHSFTSMVAVIVSEKPLAYSIVVLSKVSDVG